MVSPYFHIVLSFLNNFVAIRITGLRKSPSLTLDNWKELSPVGLWASLAHAFSVLALGAGAVSFGQIVKSAEPVFAAATNAVLLKVYQCPLIVIRRTNYCPGIKW